MNKFIDLIQVALGHKETLDATPTADEWNDIFTDAQRQALCGIAFSGVERLPKAQRPSKEMILNWYMIVSKIEEKNRHINTRSVQVQAQFQKDGFLGCVLKGQGNAVMYPAPLRRQCGDIDIWLLPKEQLGKPGTDLKKNREIIAEYVMRILQKRNLIEDRCIKYHHIEFPVLKDVEIEVHFFPMFMQSHRNRKHLLEFFTTMKDEVFSNQVELPERSGQICVPTPRFNAVYQLTHIFVHFIIEGIGLRHFIDYYYVLRNLAPEDKPFVVHWLKRINMYGFSRAVMYVMREVLGLDEQYLFSPPDVKKGKVLLSEIFHGGNFGKYETRYWTEDSGFVSKNWQKLKRNAHFFTSYTSELMAEPVFRLYHYWWGKRFQNKIMRKISQ